MIDIVRRFPRSLHNLFQLFSLQADQTCCFMNSNKVPELVFQQNPKQRLVFHHEFFQLLQQEAQQMVIDANVSPAKAY